LRKKTRNSYRNKSDLASDYEVRRKKKNKRRKRELENKKEKFRKSREWKDFRSKMAILFNHRDYITGKKLVKGFNVHHLKTEQDSEAYCDISRAEDFMPLNSYCHKLLHYLFPYYVKDKTIIDRLVEVLDKMCKLAPNNANPIDDIEEPLDEDNDNGELQDEEQVENPIDNIEESQPEYDIPEQGPDEFISSEELGS